MIPTFCTALLILWPSLCYGPSVGDVKSFLQSELDVIVHEHWSQLMESEFFKDELANFSPEDSRESISNNHVCVHDKVMRSAVSYRYSDEMNAKFKEIARELKYEREKRSISWGPIRIVQDNSWISTPDSLSCTSVGQVVDLETAAILNPVLGNTYTCKQTDILTAFKINLLTQSIVPAVLAMAKTILSVQTIMGNLVLDSTYQAQVGYECRENSGVYLPNFLFAKGQPSADYYLLVSAHPVQSNETLAFASPCSHYIESNGLLSRPYAGSINFNPGTSQLNDPNLLLNVFEYSKVVRVGLHELTHALGFTADLYQYYVDSNGTAYNVTIPAFYNSVIHTYKVD